MFVFCLRVVFLLGDVVKTKRILKFYFCAEELENALDHLIYKHALSSGEHTYNGERVAEKILKLTESKSLLGELWAFLDGVIKRFDRQSVAVLYKYAMMRYGINRLCDSERKFLRRVVVRFTRRIAGRLFRYARGIGLVDDYYCLLNFKGGQPT